jgi:hypothetical protein
MIDIISPAPGIKLSNDRYRINKSSSNYVGNTRVKTPYNVGFTASNDMTIGIWVKGATQSSKGIFSHYDSAGGSNRRRWILFTSGTKVTAFASQNGTATASVFKNYTSSVDFFDSNWNLLVMVLDSSGDSGNGSLNFYKNGVLDASPTKTTDGDTSTLFNNTTDGLMTGAIDYSSPASHFVGQLAKPFIFNSALSAAQIAEIYNSGTPKNLLYHSGARDLIYWGRSENSETPYLYDVKNRLQGLTENMTAANLQYTTTFPGE